LTALIPNSTQKLSTQLIKIIKKLKKTKKIIYIYIYREREREEWWPDHSYEFGVADLPPSKPPPTND
jgi:hypothetical protein